MARDRFNEKRLMSGKTARQTQYKSTHNSQHNNSLSVHLENGQRVYLTEENFRIKYKST